MVNITHKSVSLRKATATATVQVSAPDTILAIRERRVPKGDVLEFARAAGLLGIKKTSELIPDCHPLPIEFAAISYEFGELELTIHVTVHTIYKTGVEVEAMHGASITALVIYDMLKPIDPQVSISSIRLLEKTGGKSDRAKDTATDIACAVIVCSDRTSAGAAEDRSGKIIVEKLAAYNIRDVRYVVAPDEVNAIQQAVHETASAGARLIICTGGTGVSGRDVTPEAVMPLLTTTLPGIMETARQYSQQRTPFSMLSRGIAGFMKDALVLTFPGSANAAAEYMDALFPAVLHVFGIRNGESH